MARAGEFSEKQIQALEGYFREKDGGAWENSWVRFPRRLPIHVRVFFSPTPPLGQKRLNDCISDALYRELFMSPCLSGWDRGEDKKAYMSLCHKVLSRSQIHAVAKLKEAGIITTNLVVLPNISNVSLANNGTHVSLGRLKLGRLQTDPGSGPGQEKYFGDLSIKICEHFLPLMATAYGAASLRLDFEDFHPEKVMGFSGFEHRYFSVFENIGQGLGHAHASPMSMTGRRFNRQAEDYYATTLRQAHICQGFAQLEKALEKMDLWARYRDTGYGNALQAILGDRDLFAFIKGVRQAFIDETLGAQDLRTLICLIILVVGREMQGVIRNRTVNA